MPRQDSSPAIAGSSIHLRFRFVELVRLSSSAPLPIAPYREAFTFAVVPEITPDIQHCFTCALRVSELRGSHDIARERTGWYVPLAPR
jgi:hypothetical protein